MADDVGETNENGERNASPFERVHQLFQIDASIRVRGGMNEQVAVLPDGKKSFAPACNIVQLSGIGSSPTVGGLTYLGRNDGSSGAQLNSPRSTLTLLRVKAIA